METSNTMDPKEWDWIQEFETADEPYKSYYKTDNTHVKIHFIYMNGNSDPEHKKQNEIQEKKQILFFLQEKNVLSEDEILSLLKTHSTYKKKHYTLQSIYVYHCDLAPDDILVNSIPNATPTPQLKEANPNQPIILHQTIECFQDLNEIFFFFQEKIRESPNASTSTRRNMHSLHHNKTAKAKRFIHSESQKKETL